MTLESGITGGM